MRQTKTTAQEGIDLAVPIDKNKLIIAEDDCLGKEWDMSTAECPICSMCDICSILYQEVLEQRAKVLSDPEKPFLDETDFHAVNEQEIFERCQKEEGIFTSSELVALVMKQAKTQDDVAAIEWVKRFKAKFGLKIKAGIIYLS